MFQFMIFTYFFLSIHTAFHVLKNQVFSWVIYADGTPARNVAVSLHRDDYLAMPGTENSMVTHTNSDGMFRIDSLKNGTFTIEINEGDSLGALIRFSKTSYFSLDARGKAAACILKGKISSS